MAQKPNVLITGAGGYLGSMVCRHIAARREAFGAVIGLDIRIPAPERKSNNISYVMDDIRGENLAVYLRKYAIETVVHLAAMVSPPKSTSRETLFEIEVGGTRNLLNACVETGVKTFIFTSSGAAYGYHADMPALIDETTPLRGNPEFAYADHKRQAEEILADYRERHPHLKQLIFRPGTILGADVNNQITDLFRKPLVLGLNGAHSPFVFIWDEDVAAVIIEGILGEKSGIFNLAGDGILTLPEIARILRKPYLPLPVALVKSALWVLKKLNLTQYGPEQVNFIRYRPVLDNRRLKTEFGYKPRKNTREVFDFFLVNRQSP